MAEMEDFNTKVIEEFRANQGRVGGMFEGSPMVLLTTTGARSGKRRTNPLVYLPQKGNRIVVVASKGGAPTNPDWYHNLVAHPDVTIEVGPETYEATATVLTGEDRERAFAEMVARSPQFGEYQRATTRTIPIVALDPKG